ADLSSPTPAWTSGTGLPDVPVNDVVVDPQAPATVYAATDIGVYRSVDSGATWVPFGTGLPAVAVFDMALVPGTPSVQKILRVATHGRGMWEIGLASGGISGLVFDDVNGDG